VQARLERPGASRLAIPLALLVGALFLTTGCGTVNAPLGNLTAISASSASVRVNQNLQIQNRMSITAVPLTFFVNGVQGGNSQVGTISAAGLYTAPALVPTPNTVTITATANGHPDAAPGKVTVAVLNPIPILSSVTPSSITEGNTTITVNGSAFVYGAQILWNGSAVATTFVSSTEVAAVITAPAPGTYPLLVGNPNPGAANSATLNVPVGPGKVVLMIQPGNTDVRVTNSLDLDLQVTGTANTGVTLAVNGIPGGNATVGTATASNGSIHYTAPAVVPTPSNIVQLTITSTDNPQVSINQNISVLNPIPILTSATPSTFNTGTATVVVQGQKFINGAQVLQDGSPVPTTFNTGSQLTATLSLTQAGNFDIQVLNPAPGPATSADLIALVNGTQPVPLVSPEDASRFLEQATFGATDADIHDVSMNGYQAWLNEQFALPATPDEPFVEQSILINNPPCASGDLKCNTALFEGNDQGEIYYQDAFWQDALAAPDELRQRVKYALSEIFVISTNSSSPIESYPRGEAGYYDMLGKDAFGNFRTLLNDITLNPMMGNYLSMLGNDKGNANTDPDENYAREVMQLFTIGLYQLNDDGSQKLDPSGNPIPTYSNVDVQGLAKVFTGYSWNVPGNTSDTAWSNCCLYVGPGFGEDILPMTTYPSHHSTAEKDFLGVTIPSSGSPDTAGDLKTGLDTLFNHPNLPAFFSRQLIQHLVTSNPSPAYVSRIAAVFEDDGTGVRGNLKAVITAILLDPEARDAATDLANPQYGKVREALLRYTEWARAFTAQSRTGSYGIGSTEDPIWGLGQMTLRSPTVFNWFAPGYVPPGTSIEQANLVAPEMQMTNVTTVVGYLNSMQDAIGSNSANGSDIFSSYGAELALAANPGALLDRINLLLMAGEMDGNLYNEILGAVNAIPIPAGDQNAINAALTARVETAVYLTMASPSFAAQF
jgi:uncharacterized protein (DUF1800 family)